MSHRARSPVIMRCTEHEGKPFEFYCRSCESLGCSMCVLVSHRDHTDEVSDASEALPEHLTRLKKLYEEANAHLETAQEMMDSTATTIGKLKENKDCAEKRIRGYFQRMRNILIDREHLFINAVRHNAEERKTASSNIRKSVAEVLQGLVLCVKELWDLSNRHGDILVLKEEKLLSARLKELSDLLKEFENSDEIYNPNTTIILPCIEDQNFEKICRLVGNPSFRTCSPNCNNDILSMASPEYNTDLRIINPPPVPPRPKGMTSMDPQQNSLSTRPSDHPRSRSSIDTYSNDVIPVTPPPIPPKSPIRARRRNELPQWLLDCKDKMNKENANNKSSNSSRSNSDQLTIDDNDTNIIILKNVPKPKPKPRQQKINQSDYETPVITTKKTNGISLSDLRLNELKINVDPPTPKSEQMPCISEPILRSQSHSPSSSRSGSQSDDSSTLQVYEILLKQNIKKSPVYPAGVCIGPSNTLIAWDTHNCCIRILTTTGKFLDYIRTDDFNELEPVYICTDKSNNILVLDGGTYPRILKFSKTGKYLSKLVPKGLRSCPMTKPQGMAVSHHGNILVTDWGKSCVHIFDSSGKYIKNFGSSNTSSGQFMMQPTGIVVDYNGRVIITDGMAHHIWIYTPDGDMLNHFGWHGSNAGELHIPFGVSVCRNGYIYITEQGNNRVSVFKETGEHIKCFGGKGSSMGEFDCPKHLCIDIEGRLIVSDEGNHRLQVFDI